MLLNVRYEHEPGCCIWPIPFAFNDPGDIGVALIDDAGIERRLAHDVDYQIWGSQVVAFVPAGHALTIFTNAPCSLAENSRRVAKSHALDAQVAQVAQVAPLADVATSAVARLAAPEQSAPAAQAVAQPATETVIREVVQDDARVKALEERLAGMEEEQARALALARQAEADAQVAAVRQAAESGLADLREAASASAEKLAGIGSLAEQRLQAQAAEMEGLTGAARELGQELAESARQADLRVGQAVARLESRVAELEAELGRREAGNVQTLQLAAAQATGQIAQASEAAQARAARASELSGQAWMQTGYQIFAQDYPQGALLALPEPLAYWPGRNSVCIAVNGKALTPELDFSEVGSAIALSNTIRMTGAINTGDIMTIWIAPSNAGQAAEEAASRAERASHEASGAAARAASAGNAVQTLADRTVSEGTARLNEINQAGNGAVSSIATVKSQSITEFEKYVSNARNQSATLWQACQADIANIRAEAGNYLNQLARQCQEVIVKVRQDAQERAEQASRESAGNALASGHSSSQAHELALCAWQAAFQASIDHARPGIASVTSMEELSCHVSGIYLINPHLRSHTPFMGVWPVQSLDEANFDGVFFLGKPYPDQPALPDNLPYPERPGEIEEMKPLASQTDWLPCNHNHGA